MEKLQAAREDKDREHSIREQEIELNREAMERSKEKTELEKRSLLFRIKKLVESCKDVEYSYNEAENMLETARKVLSNSEEFSTEENLMESLSKGIDYLCVSRAGHKDLLEKSDKDNLVCFVNKGGQEVKTQFLYRDVEYLIGEKVFISRETLLYVETPAKEAKERGIFGKKQLGFETGLKHIK